ncbi:type VII secretion target [Williamsia herbipolensis]|uniref:type VII secretion target n=1 Tax=Williamsia herbipolensis TaxID=1603258 RepID=UPI0005F77D8B|nr:type VII secretion target [Williamsia herbipolensis]
MDSVSVTPDALSQLHHTVTALAASVVAPHAAVAAMAPFAATVGPIGAEFAEAILDTTTRHTTSVADHGRRLALIGAAVEATRVAYLRSDTDAARSLDGRLA